MRRIKLFEGYSDSYYERVSNSGDLPQVVSMSDKNIKKIINLFGMVKVPGSFSQDGEECYTNSDRLCINLKGYFPHLSGHKKWLKLYKTSELQIQNPTEITLRLFQQQLTDDITYIHISEADDDYFRVGAFGRYSRWYYKCDQMDGLVQLLKDLKILK